MALIIRPGVLSRLYINTSEGMRFFASDLTDTGVTAGTYGSASTIPVISVDAKGRIGSVQLTAVSGGGGGSVAGISSTATSTKLTLSNSSISVGADIIPTVDNTYSLGSAQYRWKDVFVSANTIYLGDNTIISGTSINIQADVGSSSLAQIPTLIASKLVAKPFTYTPPGGSAINVRPSIEFQSANGTSYPISFNTETNEFSLDAGGNYGTGALVAKKLSLTTNTGDALVVTGGIGHTGSYLNTSVGSAFRFDGNVSLGFDSTQTLTVKGTTTFQGPVVMQGSVGLGDGNDAITINAGAANPLVVTASNFNVASGGNVTVGGNLSVTGNLTISGTTTTIDSNTVNIGDNILILNSDVPGYQEPTENAGIQIARGTESAARWFWDETNDYWSPMGGNIGNIGSMTVGTLTASTIIGTLTAANATRLATARTIALVGDVTGSASFDGSANATLDVALANSGVVVGTYTKVSVNAKGLVTSGASLASSDVTTALGFTPISENQTITVSGDVSGSGATAIALTLANSGVVAGTYSKVTVNAKGLVTSGASLASSDVTTALGFTPIAENQTITVSGDASGSGSTAIALTLANSGVVAGTYAKVAVNAKGLVTSGGSLASSDVTTALGFTPISTNETITVSGDASGSGSTAITLTLANSGVAAGTYNSVVVDAKGRVTNGTNTIPYVGLNFVINGGGAAITTGIKGYIEVPFACTVVGWTVVLTSSTGATVSESIAIDITSATYANFGSGTSIVGAGTKPNVSSGTKGQSAPSSWTTTTIAEGSVLGFNVTTAPSTAQQCTVSLKLQRT